ncbi:CIC_collapsed_G0020790.mRNA.1.CDS.1 [Saccharomyces cerevisiae]|nr:CIC_collapsed_G0020790.mRNA.1.CDS.1 [Saccharomyces cerevisiae]
MNSTAAAINPNPNVIPFDDTYILYDSHDFLSFLSAYFSLMPILVLAFYLSWFIITRELEACIVAFGQLMNEIFNNVIKNIIKQPRPVSFGASFQNDTIRSGYGMPSAHSQFMGFCFTYNSLKIYFLEESKLLRKMHFFWCIGFIIVLRLLFQSLLALPQFRSSNRGIQRGGTDWITLFFYSWHHKRAWFNQLVFKTTYCQIILHDRFLQSGAFDIERELRGVLEKNKSAIFQ